MAFTEREGIFGIFRRRNRRADLLKTPRGRAKLQRWATSTETRPLSLSPELENARREFFAARRRR